MRAPPSVASPERVEMLRRLRVGDLGRLFQHRYGITFPDDDAGREDLRELLLPVSWGPNADVKMPNIIEVWAPWMSKADATLLIDDIEQTPIRMRKPTAAEVGERQRVTNAQRERLRLWTIMPCDLTPEELAEHRKAKRRTRQRNYRHRKRQRRAEYLATNSINRDKPWEPLGFSRATYYRRKKAETGASTDKAAKRVDAPISRAGLRAGRSRSAERGDSRRGRLGCASAAFAVTARPPAPSKPKPNNDARSERSERSAPPGGGRRGEIGRPKTRASGAAPIASSRRRTCLTEQTDRGYDEDDEPWRIERLQQVAGKCPLKVDALHDHKGHLSVHWNSAPVSDEILAVERAWKSQNEFAETESEHVKKGLTEQVTE